MQFDGFYFTRTTPSSNYEFFIFCSYSSCLVYDKLASKNHWHILFWSPWKEEVTWIFRNITIPLLQGWFGNQDIDLSSRFCLMFIWGSFNSQKVAFLLNILIDQRLCIILYVISIYHEAYGKLVIAKFIYFMVPFLFNCTTIKILIVFTCCMLEYPRKSEASHWRIVIPNLQRYVFDLSFYSLCPIVSDILSEWITNRFCFKTWQTSKRR